MSVVTQNSDDLLVTRDNQVLLYREQNTAAALEKVLATGDLSKLNTQERLLYYRKTCESCGLNPLTKPFIYITLNGKMLLYPVKECAEQLRMNHGVALKVTKREALFNETIYQVTAFAQDRRGRTDEAVGCVTIKGLQAQDLANALMKAETKAKRRVTFSICGLGWMADAADQVEAGYYNGMGPDVETTDDEPDLDPSFAEVVDPVAEDAKHKAKGDFMTHMSNWAAKSEYAWAPAKNIIEKAVDELEQRFGAMTAKKWTDLLEQPKWLESIQGRVEQDYAAVDSAMRRKTSDEPTIRPENDEDLDKWDAVFVNAREAEADERIPGDD